MLDASRAGQSRGSRKSRSGGRGRALRRALLLGLGVVTVGLAAGPAAAEDDRWPGPAYQPDRAGHPLRVVAYVLHPVGVVLDYAILRPAWWLGQHEPLRTLFGVRD